MFFQKKVGIDLGTANTLVYVKGQGIVLNEPTIVAYSIESYGYRQSAKKILAVGEEAKEMLGRTPGSIIVSRPMREGVIADYTTTLAMISYFLRKSLRGKIFWPEIVISIPGGASQVEKRAVVSACKQAGASNVYLIEEPLAAAIGAKIPISQPSGHMIVNIGGGTTEIAIISLGQLVVYKTVRVAGNKFDEAIMQILRKKNSLIIGERTAEEIKIKVGNALIEESRPVRKIEIKGRDFYSGLPETFEVDEKIINEALAKPLKLILEGIREVLSQAPPELAADIVDKGIVLSGGSSLLTNIDRFFTHYLGLPAFVVEEPLLCVIRGIGLAIENLNQFKEAIR
ncbi:MAG: rod shape-determining protein [Patescibacteria group bacterium]|nr:rod shape-determining protein [Patescibacteria group bacterium]